MEIKCTAGEQKPINSLQLRYRAAKLVDENYNFSPKYARKKSLVPAERNAFVFVKQHGRRDVRCESAIYTRYFHKIST